VTAAESASLVYVAWWALVVLLMLAGIVGTVLPAMPGPVLMFCGVVLGAWIDHFQRIGIFTIGACALMTALAIASDYLAASMGAKHVRASKAALAGAALGTLVGVFTGLVGLLFMPLLGAAVGEFLNGADLRRASQVGFATWLGMLIGTALKLALVFLMLGLFLLALATSATTGS
jgi:uncharacterized protein YqgC (DUF456 family)